MFCLNKNKTSEFLPRNLVYFEGANPEAPIAPPVEGPKDAIPKPQLADTPDGRNQIRFRAQEFLKKHPENDKVKKLLFDSTQLEAQKKGEEARNAAKELYSALMSSPDAVIMQKQEDTFNKPRLDRLIADQVAFEKKYGKAGPKPVD